MTKKQKKTDGFTLVELIVTLAVLAILAAIVLPSFSGYMDREQEKECRINRKAYLGYLESMRALDPDVTMAEVIERYQDEITCPGGGTYEAVDENTIRCTKHGEDVSLSGTGSDGKLDNEEGTEKALYTVTVYNGTADVTSCAAGTTVTITANAPQTGEKFQGWTVTSGNASPADASASVTTFLMPEGNVEIHAAYVAQLYQVSVTGGTAAAGNQNGTAIETTMGQQVTLTAEVGTGMKFVRWDITGVEVAAENLSSPSMTFQMPAENVSATAVLEAELYTLTVENGTAAAAGSAQSTAQNTSQSVSQTTTQSTSQTVEQATAQESAGGTAVYQIPYGSQVTVTANAAAQGKQFLQWNVTSGNVNAGNLNQENITFTMPAENISLTAEYEDVLYTVTVENGMASTYSCTAGTEVRLAAYPDSGQAFVNWEVTEGTVTLADADLSMTSFTMPYENVSVRAVCKPVYLETEIYKDGAATGEIVEMPFGAVQPPSETLEENYVFQDATKGSDTPVVLTGIYSSGGNYIYYYSIDGNSALVLEGTPEEEEDRLLLKDTDIRLNYEQLEKNYTVIYTYDGEMGEVSGPTVLKSKNETVPLTFTVTPGASFEVKSAVLIGPDEEEQELGAEPEEENGVMTFEIDDVSDYMGDAREGELEVKVNLGYRDEFKVSVSVETSDGETETWEDAVAYNETWEWVYDTSSEECTMDYLDVNGLSVTIPSGNSSAVTQLSEDMAVTVTRTYEKEAIKNWWVTTYNYYYRYDISVTDVKCDLSLKSHVYGEDECVIVLLKVQGVSVYYCQDTKGSAGKNLNASLQQVHQGDVIKTQNGKIAVFYVKPDDGYEARFQAAGSGTGIVDSISRYSYNGKNTAVNLGCTNEFHYTDAGYRTVLLTSVPLEYTVTYNLNGGTGTLSDTNTYTVEDGSNVIQVSSVIPRRDGYVFTGWEMGGQTYYGGERLNVSPDTLSQISGTTFPFTAKWERQEEAQQIMYTVEYYLEQEDGSYLPESRTYLGAKDGQAIAIPLEFEGYAVDLTNPDTVQIGDITDNGSLVLKLYYRRQEASEERTETPDAADRSGNDR